MGAQTTTQSDLLESRNRVRFLAAVLATGTLNGITAAVVEDSRPEGPWATMLGLFEAIVVLFVIAVTIELASERSARRLVLVSASIMATPLLLIALLNQLTSGGHDNATFGLLYFCLACGIAGLSLFVVAVVRYTIEFRQKQKDEILWSDSSYKLQLD
jgi:hypothetical protein